MKNPFGSQEVPGSYVNLKKRLFQGVQSANINDLLLGVIQKAFDAENVVLSRPERKRLFSQIVQMVAEDLTKKLDDGFTSV